MNRRVLDRAGTFHVNHHGKPFRLEKKVRVPQRAIPIKIRDQERTKLDVPLSSYSRVHAEVSKFGDLGNEKKKF